jgi:hypothetical protein
MNMSILLGLTPFIVFFVIMRAVSPLAGLAAAFALSVLLGLRQWRRGESVKVLEVGSLVLFGVLLLYTLIAAPDWTVATVRLAVDGGLLAIVLVSLAIGMPFTLQYARETVPKELWTSPLFMTTNRRITAVWAAAFAVMTSLRRGRALCRGSPGMDRHCGLGHRLRRSGLVHAMVSGRGATTRRQCGQRGHSVMKTPP